MVSFKKIKIVRLGETIGITYYGVGNVTTSNLYNVKIVQDYTNDAWDDAWSQAELSEN